MLLYYITYIFFDNQENITITYREQPWSRG